MSLMLHSISYFSWVSPPARTLGCPKLRPTREALPAQVGQGTHLAAMVHDTSVSANTCSWQVSDKIPVPHWQLWKQTDAEESQTLALEKRGKSFLWLSRLGSSELAAFAFRTACALFPLALQNLTLADTGATPHTLLQSPPPHTTVCGQGTFAHVQNAHVQCPTAGLKLHVEQLLPTPRAGIQPWAGAAKHKCHAHEEWGAGRATKGGWMHGWHLLLLFCR